MQPHSLRYVIGASLVFVLVYFILPPPLPFMLVFFGSTLVGYFSALTGVGRGQIRTRRGALAEGAVVALLSGGTYLALTGAASYADFMDRLREQGASGGQAAALFVIANLLLGVMFTANGGAGGYMAGLRGARPPGVPPGQNGGRGPD